MASQLPVQQDLLNMSAEDLLYEVMESMTKPQLDALKKDIDDEIELRKFKEKKIKQIRLDISKETEKILQQAKLKIGKSKHVVESEEDDEDEVIEAKPRRRNNKK